MPGEEKKQDLVLKAEQLLRAGQREEAATILAELLKSMPKGWKPVQKRKDGIAIHFWDQMEFFSYVAYIQQKDSKDKRNVTWETPSYSKAYYLVAFLAVEEGNWQKGLELIDSALKLEPDHPTLLCEKALILGRLGKHKEALAIYQAATRTREWAPVDQHARAMRGAAIALIDLGKLEEAENLLRESLKLEPTSKVALNELAYIEKLKGGAKPTTDYDLVRK